MNNYEKDILVETVKACGHELIDRAEDFVGNDVGFLTDFTIWIRIPREEYATIEVQKEQVSKNACCVAIKGVLNDSK